MKNYYSIFQGLPGYWSRGKFYPAIMGGSDAGGGMGGGDAGGSANAAATAMLSGGTEGTGDKAGSGTTSQGSTDNSFASEVLGSLEGVSDTERPILEKYLKGIDAQVNNRFQGIHDQYSAFKGMDADNVQQAMGLMALVEQNPMEVFKTIGDALGYELDGDEGDEFGEDGEELEYEDGEEGESDWDLPEPFMEQFNHLNEIVEAMAEIVLENQESSKAQEEDQELETELEGLHDKYGDFDEEFVLSWAAANDADLEGAVKYHNSFTEKLLSNNGQKPPPNVSPVLSGNGAPSNDVVNPTQLDGKQTKNLVAQLIAASSQE